MELKESLSIVAKLVLGSMGEQKEPPPTQMGVGLFNLVKKEISQKSKELPILSPEIDRKIKQLKMVEGEGGISWIDLYSWNLLPHFFQTEFTQILDPLMIWQGVFMLRAKLQECENTLWSKLPFDLSVYELKDLNSYHLTILGVEKSYYDMLSPKEFEKKKQRFESQCIRSIGNTNGGVVIKKRNLSE